MLFIPGTNGRAEHVRLVPDYRWGAAASRGGWSVGQAVRRTGRGRVFRWRSHLSLGILDGEAGDLSCLLCAASSCPGISGACLKAGGGEHPCSAPSLNSQGVGALQVSQALGAAVSTVEGRGEQVSEERLGPPSREGAQCGGAGCRSWPSPACLGTLAPGAMADHILCAWKDGGPCPAASRVSGAAWRVPWTWKNIHFCTGRPRGWSERLLGLPREGCWWQGEALKLLAGSWPLSPRLSCFRAPGVACPFLLQAPWGGPGVFCSLLPWGAPGANRRGSEGAGLRGRAARLWLRLTCPRVRRRLCPAAHHVAQLRACLQYGKVSPWAGGCREARAQAGGRAGPSPVQGGGWGPGRPAPS